MKPANVVIAIVICLAVVLLGALVIDSSVKAYHARHRAEHRGRLQQLLTSHPDKAQLQQTLGSPLQAVATDQAILIARQHWGGPSFSISAELARRAPQTLIYLVDDMVYLLLVDPNGAMVDFVLLPN